MKERTPVWQDPAATLNMRYPRTRASEQEMPQFFGRKAEGEALRNIISKLSEERNLRDLHLKQYHMSTAQFKKRTTHWDIPGFCMTSISTWGKHALSAIP